MDTQYKPQEIENKIYSFWEKEKLFEAKVDKTKKPFCIILPPPNANGSLHMGHATFVYEDIMIRYHKMMGDETLWLLGLDHAGFETQYVYEKYLRKQGKSRFDFDRDTLFHNIWDFVMENKDVIKSQLRRLGFALDWTKEKFAMDPDIVKIVYETFKKLHDAGLLYRGNRLVNYCTRDGTSFSDLEVVNQEKEGLLYYIDYPLADGDNKITVATTRPETMFGDTAIMVHPDDKRYKTFVGKTVLLPLTNKKIPVITDTYVDMKFGTGAVKVTPSHDFNDYEVGKRHNLENITVIGFDGKMKNTNGVVDGLKVLPARDEVIKRLKETGLLKNIKKHKMVVKSCYRCGNALEPLPLEQWYIKTKPLVEKAKELVEKGKIKIYPKRFTKRLITILDNFIDWNISRQIVWGIRIPAYQCKNYQLPITNYQSKSKNQNPNSNKWFVSIEKPAKCKICGECKFEQDPDTFDTWFSSGQWPFVTLMTEGKEFYNYFYPTTVMETGHDILRAWVARMIMLGFFTTKEVPFKNVYLHGMLRDSQGQKMSKSKGNVIDPLIMVDKYGADALRATLLFGTKDGGDMVVSEQKIIGMRNFTNKIWNIARFIEMNSNNVIAIPRHGGGEAILSNKIASSSSTPRDDKGLLNQLQKEYKAEKKKYMGNMQKYRFSMAFETVYQFIWHRYADYYIEQLKDELKNGNIEVLGLMKEVFFENLKMLHPFIPFVTEAIWQVFNGEKTSILFEKL
jgi:valyl-tRNA synthetase